MKNALVKDALREIRKSIGRFLAIFTIVAIGSGFFAGIKATMPDMLQTAEDYFKEKRLMDLRMVSTLGVRSKDVEAVKTADEVEGVMAGYSKDVYYRYESQNLVLKFMSYNSTLEEDNPNKLNKPELIEGRYPESEGECLIEVKSTSPETFRIGNEIKISEPDNSKKITDTLTNDVYKIVGIVASPMYIGYERDATDVGNGSVVSNVFVPEYDFVGEYYTDLYVKFKGLDSYEPFSDEYKDRVNSLRSSAEEKFKQSVNERYGELVQKAQKQLESAENSKATLEQVLSCDRKTLLANQKGLEKSLSAARAESEKAADGSAAKLLAESKVLQTEEALGIVKELLQDKDTNGEYHKKYSQQLSEINIQIEKGSAELENLSEPKMYSFNRFEASDDYSSFYGDSQKIDSISKVFPVFFILVAMLVCLTTMTRMVEEQRTLMGTYKANGISDGKIAGKYLFYAASASVLGSVLGSVIGLKLIPRIIYDSYKIMYNIPKITTSVKPVYVILCALVSAICTMAAVMIACLKELRSQPSQLMRPRPPKNGKRVMLEKHPIIWNRLSFLGKVTVRNLVRYKKRFFMTVIGVAGCTALIVTGFGLKNSIKTIADKQFNDVFVYSGLVMLNSDNYSGEELSESLSAVNEIDKFMMIRSEACTANTETETQSATLIVMSEPENAEDYIHFRDGKKGERLYLKDGEVIITEKLSKLLNVKEGDKFDVQGADDSTAELKISAVSRNYAMHYIYMTPKTYEEFFGKRPVSNLAFVNLKDGIDDESFKQSLIKKDEIYGMAYKDDSSKGFLNSVDSLDAVVLLLIICAGGLAVVVLYNLANINITERIREIASIKVLGFYENETSAYICRENYISAVIGIILGFGLGKILHYFVVITSEVDMVMFNRELVWWAYLVAGLLTTAFTIIVNLILRLVIRKIDMVESLKSVE